MALRGAPWVLTLSTMLPHQAKKRVEAGGASAATGARPRAPWAPPRDARAAWQMWWTHWNNARWRSWSKTSQKVSDERKRLLQPDVWSAGPHHLPGSAPDFYYTLLSFPSSSSSSFFLSVLFSFSLSLFPSVLNPHTFRWEASLCFFSSIQTDSIGCLGLLSTVPCIFITTWQIRCKCGCTCLCV